MKPNTAASPIAELWRWHESHDLDRRAPPWIVQRANDHHTAAVAARAPLSLETDYSEGLAQSARDEIAGGMVSHAERCDSNARLAPRLEKLGLEEDAQKLSSCRTSGRLTQRESDAQYIPLPDHKCRRPRVCPHCARDESARLRRRYLKRLRRFARRLSLYFFTVSPSQVPADRLEFAWRELFAVFDLLRRTQAGSNIEAALTTVENTVPTPGLHHPHLHAIVAAAGSVSWKAWRREINRLLRARFAPVIPGDVYYRPSTADFVRVEHIRFMTGAAHGEQHNGKRRVVCDHSRDVVTFSDGTSQTVAETLKALERDELMHGYRLVRPLTGARLRIKAVHHAPGQARHRDILTLESASKPNVVHRNSITLDELRDQLSRGTLTLDPSPMSFQIDFRPVAGNDFQVQKSLRELLKYLVKPGDLHAMGDDDLRAVVEAGGRRFRRTRAYGLLHGGKTEEPDEHKVEILRPVGLFRYDPARRDVELRVGGQRLWASEVAAQARARREAERSGLKDLIPPDRSAGVNKALKSANDSSLYDATQGPGPAPPEFRFYELPELAGIPICSHPAGQ